MCDVCGADDEPIEKQESLLVPTYFSYCSECRDKYAEKKEVVMDFLQQGESIPNWFSDIKYYEDGEYKKANNLI